MKRNISKIKQKKAEIAILERLFDTMQSVENDCFRRYDVVGKEQAKDWSTGELKWEDEEHTIPKMINKYDYIPINESDMDDEEYAKFIAMNAIKTALEKML